jgi:hypothetical protein
LEYNRLGEGVNKIGGSKIIEYLGRRIEEKRTRVIKAIRGLLKVDQMTKEAAHKEWWQIFAVSH